MQVMIDSPYYAVYEMLGEKEGEVGGIEIMNKATKKEIFLVGEAADYFRLEVERLAATDPSMDDVEDFLDAYRPWMQNSVMVH